MKQSKMSSSRQDDGMILINSGERLTIENTADFARLIQAGLAEAKSVAVSFDPDLEVDITAMQVLCSAHRTAMTAGKVFASQGEMPQALLNLVVAVGSERHRECNYNAGSPCPWFEGGK